VSSTDVIYRCIESWYPIGRGYTQTLFNDAVISAIAKAHGKASAQVILLVIFYGASANTSGYIKPGSIADAKNLKATLDKAKENVSFVRAKSTEKEKGSAALTPEQQEVYAAYEEICRALIAKDRAIVTAIRKKC
jgi:hypothetical protein